MIRALHQLWSLRAVPAPATIGTVHDPDAQLWEPTEQPVPPVIGRASLQYDTRGEVGPQDEVRPVVEFESDDGVSVTISF
jgi:hypothetical protein